MPLHSQKFKPTGVVGGAAGPLSSSGKLPAEQIPSDVGIPEAPINGQRYVRKDGGWVTPDVIAQVTVANQAARLALTISSVQNGDYVHQTDTGVLYEVTDETKLAPYSTPANAFTSLATVEWGQITSKPTTFTPAAHAASHGPTGSDPLNFGATRHDVVDPIARYALASANPLPKLGDIVREGETTPYAYYCVVDVTALGSEAGYAAFGAALPVPPARTNLTVSSIVDDGLTLSWTNPSSSVTVTGIRIYYRVANAASWITADTLSYTATAYVFTNLTGATNYELRVQALSANGPSLSAYTTATTAAAWTPSNLTSSLLWLEPDYGVTVDGSNRVSLWLDKSDNHCNAVPTASGVAYSVTQPIRTPPTYVNGHVNFSVGEDLGFVKPLAPFDVGWGYSGPGIFVRAIKVPVWPTDSGGTTAFTAMGTRLELPSYWSGKSILPDELTGQANGYLSAGWKQPIYSTANGATLFSITHKKSDGTAKSIIIVQMPSAGTTPGYWARYELPNANAGGPPIFPFGVPWIIMSWGSNATTGTAQAEFLLQSLDSVTDATRNKLERYVLNKVGLNPKPLVLCFGNSLTKGYNNANNETYPYLLQQGIGSVADVTNVGYNSRTIAQLTVDEPAYTSLLRPNTTNIVVVWEVTNSIEGGITDTAAIHDAYKTLCLNLKSRGWKVVVLDCIARSWSSNATTRNTIKDTVNGLIAANWQDYADAFVPVSSNINLQNPVNMTYFNDGIHLTNAGYQIVADLVRPAVQSLLP